MSASASSNPSSPGAPPPSVLPSYLDEGFDSTALELEAERIARELKLPPCPKILDDFYREMNEDDADVRRLGDCVSADLALTAALLKAVNSPAYGLSRATSNVQQAITIIGLRATTSLISRLLFRQAFPETQGFLMREFWESTARLTEAGNAVARKIRGLNADEATTYLVFRDCGMAVLINRYPDYAPVWEMHRKGRTFGAMKLELRRYQTNHAHVGYAMAREWCVPEAMCTAILCHHDVALPLAAPRQLQGTAPKLAAFGLLMDQIISIRRNEGITPDWEVVEPFVLRELHLTPDQMVKLISEDTMH